MEKVMNTTHKTREDRRLAKLTAYAETYDRLDSAIDEAQDAIDTALEAVGSAHTACEEVRDEAAKRGDDDAYSELDELCALIDSTQNDLAFIQMPSTFQQRARFLRRTLEQERIASTASAATVNQE
jgi:hypothetical protein